MNENLPLNDEELEKWESQRDLLKEIIEGIVQMEKGNPTPTRVVEVSEEVHNLRMSSKTDK